MTFANPGHPLYRVKKLAIERGLLKGD